MTVAERTREAVRDRPFLYEALRAGVVNYTAAARYLDVGEEANVAAALRRYADHLDDEVPSGDARVRMHRGIRRVEDGEISDRATGAETQSILTVNGTGFVPDDGTKTAILATGTVSTWHLRQILGRCDAAGVAVSAAGMTESALVLVTGSTAAPRALRIAEDSLRDA